MHNYAKELQQFRKRNLIQTRSLIINIRKVKKKEKIGFRSIYIFPVSLVDDNILDFTSNHKAKNKKKRLKIS